MTISIRIVHLDHYMSTPGKLDRSYSPFSDKKLSKVPVIRIFGSTLAGQKICLHIHQVYPYFYVPYTIPAHYTTEKDIQKDILQFGTSLNAAMDLAKPNEKEKNQHIAAIVLTKGVPFYGYHIGYTSFLKIYITNPYEKQQMLDILQTNAIQNTSFQPHEAHLNFELQFLLDYNLYGMDWIHIDDRHGILEGSESFGIQFRLPLLNEPKANVHASQSSNSSSEMPSVANNQGLPIYTSRTVPVLQQSDSMQRNSYCELELDITCMSILNRHDLQEREIHKTIQSETVYLAQQKQSNSTEKLVKSLDAIWKDELKRRISRGLKDPSIPPITQITDRNVTKEPWSTEVSLRNTVEKYMLSDAPITKIQAPSSIMANILTNFQSTEALYPDAYFSFQAAQDVVAETAPISATTPISSQLNVSATPSRYRVWDLPSQVNTSILFSVMEQPSFHHEEQEGDNEEEDIEEEQDSQIADDEDDEDNFSLEDGLRNSDLAKWVEEIEYNTPRRKHLAIEYEKKIVKPRKLDFIAESQRIDDILRDEDFSVSKNYHILDFEEEEEEEKEETEREEAGEEAFQISDIPPVARPRLYKSYQQKIRDIDQVDGPNDNKDRELKRQKSAKDRWEEEKKILKKMRLRKQVDNKQSKDSKTEWPSSLPILPKKSAHQPAAMRRVHSNSNKTEESNLGNNNDKKDEIKSDSDDRLQKVSVVIRLHRPEKRRKKYKTENSQQEVDSTIWDVASTFTPKKRLRQRGSKRRNSPETPVRSTFEEHIKIDSKNSASIISTSTSTQISSSTSTSIQIPDAKRSSSCLASSFAQHSDTIHHSVMKSVDEDTTLTSPTVVSSTINDSRLPYVNSPPLEISSPSASNDSQAPSSMVDVSESIAITPTKTHILGNTPVIVIPTITDDQSSYINVSPSSSVGSFADNNDPKASSSSIADVPETTKSTPTDKQISDNTKRSSITPLAAQIPEEIYASSDISNKAIPTSIERNEIGASEPILSSYGSDDDFLNNYILTEDPEASFLTAINDANQVTSDISIHDDPEPSRVQLPTVSPEEFEATHKPSEYIYKIPPPVVTKEEAPSNAVIYQEPYYSNPDDVPRYPTVFAGKEFRLPTKGASTLPEFQTAYHVEQKAKTQIKTWTLFPKPPTVKQAKEWMKSEEYMKSKKKQKNAKSQLINPTLSNTFNFKFSASKPQVVGKKFRDHLDFFSLEVHVNTRDSLLPDPQHDPIQLIFWCLQTEDRHIPSNGYQEGYYVGVIALNDVNISKIGLSKRRITIDYAENEEDLFHLLISKVRYYDPHMLVGYEVQSASWGYLVDRGAHLGFHLLDELSRFKMTTESIKRDQWGYKKASVYKIVGRHMLNVWRLMRNELTLISYTLENVVFHLLHHRVPHYSHTTLTSWYKEGSPILKNRLFKYYMKRVQLNLDLLDASQVIRRTCESARVYGIDFYAVLTRGSQYDVESIMFRIAKPENFCLISPSRLQVASQRSLECLPLVMEPVSQFYSSPMVVLDFQSLYPSIMIAYNYCYSTCLGRVRKPNESAQFGVLPSFELDSGILKTFKDQINISPNGAIYVKPEIRKSTLAKMLSELLDTRVMIKRAMKDYKNDSGLLRLLDAKQLTLKLLANVTYGYTSASFSGRMPSVEIADSIVSTGRETLERAIDLINTTEKWGARVVYGDTDSVFIYFPGKTRAEAFEFGQEIADTVTKMNPDPIKLKFEKVYHPAVLLAKKRYVGYKYESPQDTEPVFEAKGIETVRRDGTAATQKIMESSLKILFRSQDMSELKQYLYTEWTKILSNRVLLTEFIISKEVRMGTYSSRGGPNGAIIAQARMDSDARAEPQYGERVPYVVVYRGPNAKLKDKVVRPVTLLTNNSLRLDAEYYIRKQIIPPLSRIFNLIGVDILSWYESMPRSIKVEAMNMAKENEQQIKSLMRIDQYYTSAHCVVCRKLAHKSICDSCIDNMGNTIFTLTSRQQKTQQKFRHILQTCQDCSKVSPLDAMFVIEGDQFADIPCDSLDCPIFYERLKAKKDVGITLQYDTLIQDMAQTLF